jgi:hypothetical protein
MNNMKLLKQIWKEEGVQEWTGFFLLRVRTPDGLF